MMCAAIVLPAEGRVPNPIPGIMARMTDAVHMAASKAAVVDRSVWEQLITDALNKLLRSQRKRLVELLGDPPDLANIPDSYWAESSKELSAVLGPLIDKVFLAQSAVIMSQTGISFDWALVNQWAVEAARTYMFDLVRGITQTSREALQSAVSAYFEQGQTIGDLISKLEEIYSPTRAEMIAVTEVTRAASTGEQAIAAELAKEGISMIPIWQTNDDELVCPICGPKHDKPIEDGEYPPAHPNCRCWVNHELP